MTLAGRGMRLNNYVLYGLCVYTALVLLANVHCILWKRECCCWIWWTNKSSHDIIPYGYLGLIFAIEDWQHFKLSWKIGRNLATVFNAQHPARRKRTGWSAGWLLLLLLWSSLYVSLLLWLYLLLCPCLSDCKVWRRDRGLGGRRGGGGVGQGEWTTCAKQSGLGFLYLVTADILSTQDLGWFFVVINHHRSGVQEQREMWPFPSTV